MLCRIDEDFFQLSLYEINKIRKLCSWYTRWLLPKELKLIIASFVENTKNLPSQQEEFKAIAIRTSYAISHSFFNMNPLRRFFIFLFHRSKTYTIFERLKKIPLHHGGQKSDHWWALANHALSGSLIDGLNKLNRAGLLTTITARDYWDAMVNHQNPSSLIDTILRLRQLSILADDPENWQPLIHHSNASTVVSALNLLHQAGLVNKLNIQKKYDILLAHQNIHSVVYLLDSLKRTAFFTPTNCECILTHTDLRSVVFTLELFQKLGLLSDASAQENLEILFNHTYPYPVAHSLAVLHINKLINRTNCSIVLTHPDPCSLGSSLVILQKRGWATQNNCDIVLGHKQIGLVASSLDVLLKANLLLEDKISRFNCEALLSHHAPVSINYLLHTLYELGLFDAENSQKNLDVLLRHNDLKNVALLLHYIKRTGFLNKENSQNYFDILSTHKDLESIESILHFFLENEDLLSGENARENFEIILSEPRLDLWVPVLSILSYANLLTKSTFQKLITNSDILVAGETHHLWSRIPDGMVTIEIFSLIVTLVAEQTSLEEGREQFLEFVNWLGGVELRDIAPRVDDEQNTHTASIHTSVSQSAKRLSERYNLSELVIQSALDAFQAWIHTLSKSELKESTAQRGFVRLLTSEFADYIDPVSTVSVARLLALLWLAIHDTGLRKENNVEDLKKALVESLYEIQRGYNLSVTGADDGVLEDNFICKAGTFNKLLEKFSGQLPDVELIFMSSATANLKFPRVVNEELQEYLSSINNPDDVLLNDINQTLKDGAVGKLFPRLVAPVKERIFDEFSQLYDHKREHPLLLGLMAAGEDVEVSENSKKALEACVQKKAPILTSPLNFFEMSSTLDPVTMLTSQSSNPRTRG